MTVDIILAVIAAAALGAFSVGCVAATVRSRRVIAECYAEMAEIRSKLLRLETERRSGSYGGGRRIT